MNSKARKILEDAAYFVEKRPGVFSKKKEELCRRMGSPNDSVGATPWSSVADSVLGPFVNGIPGATDKLKKAVWGVAEECAQRREFASVMAEAHDLALKEIAADQTLSSKGKQKLFAEINDVVEKQIIEDYAVATKALDGLAETLADKPPRKRESADPTEELLKDRKIELAAETFVFKFLDAKANAYGAACDLAEVESRNGDLIRIEGLSRAVERFSHAEEGQNLLVARPGSLGALKKTREILRRALDPMTAEERKEQEAREAMRPVLGIIDKYLRVPIGKILYRRFRREPAPGWCSAIGLPWPPPPAPMMMPPDMGFDNSRSQREGA